MAQEPRFPYGGQAVIEGVMIRGRGHFSLAVRRSDGIIERRTEPLNSLYTGRWRRVPVIRGVVALVETLLLGAKALQLSANIAMQTGQPEQEEEVPGWIMAMTMVGLQPMRKFLRRTYLMSFRRYCLLIDKGKNRDWDLWRSGDSSPFFPAKNI